MDTFESGRDQPAFVGICDYGKPQPQAVREFRRLLDKKLFILASETSLWKTLTSPVMATASSVC